MNNIINHFSNTRHTLFMGTGQNKLFCAYPTFDLEPRGHQSVYNEKPGPLNYFFNLSYWKYITI